MEVVWRAGALDDLESVLDYLLDIDPAMALDQVDRIEAAGNALATFPRRGRKGVLPETLELRVLGTPYTLIYRVASDVEILRVWHGRRGLIRE